MKLAEKRRGGAEAVEEADGSTGTSLRSTHVANVSDGGKRSIMMPHSRGRKWGQEGRRGRPQREKGSDEAEEDQAEVPGE